MEQPKFFFKKNDDGNLDISMDDVNQFNKSILSKIPPTGSNFILYDSKNFDTCKFRSPVEVRYAVACCNGSTNFALGYKCNLLDIFNIKSYDCSQCLKYQSK